MALGFRPSTWRMREAGNHQRVAAQAHRVSETGIRTEDFAGCREGSACCFAEWEFSPFPTIPRQVPSYTSGEPNVFQRNSLVLKLLRNLSFSKWNGAQKRTRTSTPFRVPAPEAGASTNSAIWATVRHVRGWPSGVNRVFEVFVSIVKKAVEARVRPGPWPMRGSGQAPVPARPLPRFRCLLPHSSAFPAHCRTDGNE